MTVFVAPALAVSHTHTRLNRRFLVTRGKIIATYNIEEMIVRSTKLLPVCCAICTVLVATVATVSVLAEATSAELLQDSTPYVPVPYECTIEPRTIPPPPGTPAASPTPTGTIPPPGPLVDGDTVAEITAVVRSSIACTNAGDILRALAYFTDGYVEQMFYRPEGVDYEGFLQYLATPVAVLDEGQRVAIVDISEVRQHENGVVSAIVTTGDPDDPFVDMLLFVNVDGMWLIASSTPVEVVYATPSP
jgi:hypothetical protein